MNAKASVAIALLAVSAPLTAQEKPLPIIDMHLHAWGARAGPAPIATCAERLVFLPRDPKDPYGLPHFADCETKLQSFTTDEELLRRTLEIMEEYNIIGVASGSIARVREWSAAAPDRIIPALGSRGAQSLEEIRGWAADGTIRVLGELTFQYAGLGPADSTPASYFALAEELDLPVGVHVGPGPPGASYSGSGEYRMRLSNPLIYEDLLVARPGLRIYLMHAGWPMLDQTIGLLYAHPQVYVDVGVINWFIPRPEFHAYLRRLVHAGLGKRIMFGSDQMIWPDALRIAIESIESADFLTLEQKRDIFYNNAARFLRLSEEEMARHHNR